MSAKTQAESAEISPEYRQKLEQIIDQLVSILDHLDGDADFESQGNLEPSLGWVGNAGPLEFGDYLDTELDDCDAECGGDPEPNSGDDEPVTWENHGNQTVLDHGEARV